jgi:hypothetical protein
MPALQNVAIGIRRSRRNLLKVGAIGGSAIIANLTRPRLTAAQDNQSRDDDDRHWDHDYRHWDHDDRHWHQGGNCFLKGTTIETAEGDRKIEDLAVGDLLPTVFGGICPIQWIGNYSYKRSIKAPWDKDVLPVRVAPSALGPNMPRTDLYISKDHALLIDGVLVTAGSLINGMTITLDDTCENNELEFFHIKLARHNVIYAEGTPCETVRNFDERAINFAEYLRRHGPSTLQEAACAPVFNFNRARSQITSRLRSAISPWVDRRQTFDIIRDELEERGIAVLRDRNVSRDRARRMA